MSKCENCIHYSVCEFKRSIDDTLCGHYKDKSLCVELPCKVGDYVEFGEKGFLAEVQGFVYNPSDLGWRYKLDFCTPTFDCYEIKRIIPKEEAEKKLKEIEK